MSLVKHVSHVCILNFILIIFCMNTSFARSAPDSFADLAERLSPSVVNISTTTVIEDKSRQMPSFPPGSPFEDFLSNSIIPVVKREKHNH